LVAAHVHHLQELVLAALAVRYLRVQMIDFPDGRRFWLKRMERVSWRMRLQKGNPRTAFEAELTGLQVLGDAGLPVAPIALQGPEYVVMPDVGRTLHAIVSDPSVRVTELAQAFAQAGLSLARLHQAGFVHGRPAVRDICWDGTVARFIDLERFRASRQAQLYQAIDVVMLVQTIATARLENSAGGQVAMDAALTSYRMAAPQLTLRTLRRLLPWLSPLAALASLVARIKPAAREFRAVRPALQDLRSLAA
jgi:tRNA A-37 threonylcarbamoyl transferase component Bud32